MLESPVLNNLLLKEEEKEDRFANEVLRDFWLCCVSREASLLGRREVLTGKAKFGILGDGKEVPQVAMAKAFKKGDWRSGYYRDQTFMFALGLSTVENYFAQLYADAEEDPFSGGRQMNSHFATATINDNEEWLDHLGHHNISSDVSPTAGQMARALGLAFASKKYRESEALREGTEFSNNGNEVCFCTIGDASTSEGVFWETMNAAAVERVPLVVAVWDDGYGISVPRELQTVKNSISKAMEGFLLDEEGMGIDIYVVKAWDYPALCETFDKAIAKSRAEHIPALIHVEECTQPQGHSTSGSHERYKSKERLEWEQNVDCIETMADWMIESDIAGREKIEEIREAAKKYTRECKRRAWQTYRDKIKTSMDELRSIYESLESSIISRESVKQLRKDLDSLHEPVWSEVVQNGRRLYYKLLGETSGARGRLKNWLDQQMKKGGERYNTFLYSSSEHSALRVPVVHKEYSAEPKTVNGYQVLNKFFDKFLERDPRFFAFGEDLGKIGGVNQGFAGLQEKHGLERVFDTGIREWTIVGQAIGMAMRGLKPIAEIQYLDYLIYGLEPLSDDLATVRYRSAGQQQAPAIIRTRGHRLEGIWHAGSPMGMIINSLRGMYICVPRNMTQAAGMYNTLLQSNDPGLVIECLNGYRLKERLPDNIGEYTVPLGQAELLKEGKDITLVTYGSCVRVAEAGAELLQDAGISVELVDVQTLLPFDLEGTILSSLKKTNRLIVLDEDVPGGATAYIMRQVLEIQDGYRYLDSKPVTLTSKAHRPPYGSDGDYFSKPQPEDVFEAAYELMREAMPDRYPAL